ncbi:hypothetical protein QM646_01915 [Rhodococcus erythropolis]|nr:hypothetical protein [Rhodococcus erythropolis]
MSIRYGHAWLILASNLPSSRWGDVFGGQAVVAALIACGAGEVAACAICRIVFPSPGRVCLRSHGAS